jgi:methionine synthase II (cobalamin-independent)
MLKATAEDHADDHHGLAAAPTGMRNLGTRSFLDAMVLSQFRERYVDALSVYLQEQEVAGLDIVTGGDCRFDSVIGGRAGQLPPHHMSGFDTQHRSWRR